MRFALVFFVLISSSYSLFSQLRLAKVFADQMVLQRGKPIPVWGWGVPGEQVSVSLELDRQEATVDPNGKWRLEMPTREAGGPYVFEVRSGIETVVFRDVWVGEVWLCSGQSNMEWEVRLADNPGFERQNARDSLIRHIKLDTKVSLYPIEELAPPRTGWEICTPSSAGRFSAVGYFFAKNLREKFGPGVAIGLINNTWGGSHIEAWISKERLSSLDSFRAYLEHYPTDWPQAHSMLRAQLLKSTLGGVEQLDHLDETAYYSEGFDFSRWQAATAPGAWDWQGVWAYRGKGFMAKKLEVPSFVSGIPALLRLGEHESPVFCWINGRSMLVSMIGKEAVVEAPAGVLKAGSNFLVVLVSPQAGPKHWGVGLFGDESNLRVEWEDYSISLVGEDWYKMPSWASPHSIETLQNNVACGLFNGMVAPLAPYAVAGVLWYQGESNAERASDYTTTFPLLIKDWRSAWGEEELPFYFVQLSSFGKNKSSNEGSSWAELREAQQKALALPNTGMAVTLDIGDAADIHPRNKQEVGRRLALIALAKSYGFQIEYESPRLKDFNVGETSALLTFDGEGDGLYAKDKFGYIRGFEIAGPDRIFHFTQAQLVNKNQVVVYHPHGMRPVAVRYAWSDAPVEANVYNSIGLPLGTFRTDDWPGITVGRHFE